MSEGGEYTLEHNFANTLRQQGLLVSLPNPEDIISYKDRLFILHFSRFDGYLVVGNPENVLQVIRLARQHPFATSVNHGIHNLLLNTVARLRDLQTARLVNWQQRYATDFEENASEWIGLWQWVLEYGFDFGGLCPNPEEVCRTAEKTARTAVATGSWVNRGNRWWQCPRGHQTRAKKRATSVVCTICNAKNKLQQNV
ncbi:hypothetical protein D4R52_00160 [bacterium]|nr:MAG: hypothetical protein D4R52_00160 [bacterium]